MIYNILDYGAKGDGHTLDSPAIQAAIDECSNNNGGQVLVPGGKTYRCGTIIMKSNVELHLETGAVLKASDCMDDFNLFKNDSFKPGKLDVPTYLNCDYSGKPVLYFIYAKDCEYVSITGFGKIDGNEEIFFGKITPWHIDGSFYPRMPLIYFEHITHLAILHVTLTNSGFWTTHLVGCREVLIDGVRILNDLKMANCDGIDPDHCQNVRISNCHIEAADDCIVFKNTADNMKYGPCENITVTNCTLTSTSAAIKFGTESEDIFRNICISNCSINRTNRAVSMQLRDKGSIENIIFSNLNINTRLFSKDHWWGSAEAIAITAVNRKTDSPIGHIKNIKFQNINTDGENGILIYGNEDLNISDVSFDNIHVHIRKTTSWPNDTHDLRPSPENTIIKDHPAFIYMRNARNITFRNYSFDAEPECENFVPEDIKNCINVKINP